MNKVTTLVAVSIAALFNSESLTATTINDISSNRRPAYSVASGASTSAYEGSVRPLSLFSVTRKT